MISACAAPVWITTSSPPSSAIAITPRLLKAAKPQRLFALTTKGTPAHGAGELSGRRLSDVSAETRGLPGGILDALCRQEQNPVMSDDAGQPQRRTLSNAVSVVVYEAASWDIPARYCAAELAFSRRAARCPGYQTALGFVARIDCAASPPGNQSNTASPVPRRYGVCHSKC